MASLRTHAGYLEIDHRGSPGLTPDEVAHIPGAIAVGEGQRLERDIKMCAHCQRGIVLNPGRCDSSRHYCAKCDHYICDDPICNAGCNPIRKLFDQAYDLVARDATADPLIVLTDAWRNS